MKIINIKLSVKQREILQPLFDEAEANSLVEKHGMVLLQAYPKEKTGVARGVFVHHEEAKAMKKILWGEV